MNRRMHRYLRICALGATLVACGIDQDASEIGSSAREQKPTGSPPPAPLPSPLPTATAIKIGSPYRDAGSPDTVAGCFARSIWDLQSFEGRVYLGAGDRWNNSGATTVYSFAPGTPTSFQVELVVDEEMVERFRVYDGRLYIPGTDALESWDLGNYYVKASGLWSKRRAIPNGIHVWDVASFGGSLFAYVTHQTGLTNYRSSDGGNTWSDLSTTSRDVFGIMIPLDRELWIFGPCQRGCIQIFDGSTVRTVATTIYPHTSKIVRPSRSVRFKDGVLYTDADLTLLDTSAPLLYLADLRRGASLYRFGGATPAGVRDVLVEGGAVHVLAARPDSATGTFQGSIYRSTDLASWTPIASFTVPAPPYSLERLNGSYYVGLGNQGTVAGGVASLESGSIWQVQ